MRRLLSGIKPTGNIHIGNYFGMMKQIIDLQDEYDDVFVFIADYHALNQTQNPKEIAEQSLEIAKAYLAVGLDSKKVTFYKQSDVPQTTELCWIFNCLTPIALLQRAHAYKDAVAKKQPVNMGLFDYPILMAADILLYQTNIVPVGLDQKQHLEIAQETARKFNAVFGQTFTVPQTRIVEAIATIPGLDGRKMSKSYGNTIGLFDEEKAITKKVMSIVTDSKGAREPKDPETCNVFALHRLLSTPDELDALAHQYKTGELSYKESKELLAQKINAFLAPIRKKKAELDRDPEYVKKLLEEGKEKAEKIAEKTMKDVKKKIGVSECSHDT